jgi:methylated-DNA-[protein]-cysteine S-methyltransferase
VTAHQPQTTDEYLASEQAAASTAFGVFDTAIGPCGIAWNGDVIVGTQLPEADERATRARMQKRFPAATETAPPQWLSPAIEAIRALLRGEPYDASGLELDMTSVPDLDRQVYEIAREIPPGTTITYGDIAVRLGDKTLSRAVGQALGKNPFAPLVPCHRVLSADGKMHGFSASGGVAMKLRMLRNEGWRAEEPTLFD